MLKPGRGSTEARAFASASMGYLCVLRDLFFEVSYDMGDGIDLFAHTPVLAKRLLKDS